MEPPLRYPNQLADLPGGKLSSRGWQTLHPATPACGNNSDRGIAMTASFGYAPLSHSGKSEQTRQRFHWERNVDRRDARVPDRLDHQLEDIKLAQAAAGHTTSAMTLRYHVKGRETISKAAAVVDRAYST